MRGMVPLRQVSSLVQGPTHTDKFTLTFTLRDNFEFLIHIFCHTDLDMCSEASHFDPLQQLSRKNTLFSPFGYVCILATMEFFRESKCIYGDLLGVAKGSLILS